MTSESIELRNRIPVKIITEYIEAKANVIVKGESKNEASQTLNFNPINTHKINIA